MKRIRNRTRESCRARDWNVTKGTEKMGKKGAGRRDIYSYMPNDEPTIQRRFRSAYIASLGVHSNHAMCRLLRMSPRGGARASNVAWPPIFSVIQTIRRVSQEWELAGIEGDFHSKGEKESRPFDHDSSCAAEISACKKVNVGVEN